MGLPYVSRNSDGNVIAVSERPTGLAQELLPADHPEVMGYLKNSSPNTMIHKLSRTDNEMARITEDLVDVLIYKNIINFTDLPLQAQRKLVGRQHMRRNLSALSNLVSDEDDIL